MAIKLADLFVAISADDKGLDQDLNRVEGKTKGWASGMAGNVAKAAGGIAIGAAAAAGAAVVKLASDGITAFVGFERQMNEVFTLLPGISEQAMGEMNEQVKDFAKQFGVLPEDVVPALYQALSAGVPPDNVFDFLATANKAAVGGVAELETAVDGISSVVNAYGADVLDAAKASDLMFTAVRLGKTDFNQLSASLFNVIPTAASLGVEFGDVTAALAAMTAQGTPTSVATTQLRQLLVELSKDGGKASAAFQDLAGKSFVDFIDQGGNVQDALIIMEQAAAKNNVRLSDMFGSIEAGNAALALTGRGADTFRDNLAQMADAAGATDAAFAQMDSGIGKTMEKVRAAWAVAMLDIGNALAPVIEELLPIFSAMVQNTIPPMVGFFEGLATAIRGIVGGFGQLVGFLQSDFMPTMGEANGLFAYFAEFAEENMPRVQKIVETVLSAIRDFWDRYGQRILAIVNHLFGTIFTVIDAALRTVLDVVTLVLQLITGDFEGAGETLIGIVERIWDTILQVFSNQLNALSQLMFGFDITAAGEAIVNGILQGMQNAWANVQNWFGARLQDLRDLLPFSEPKDPSSPLRNLKRSGAAIVEQLQLGLGEATLQLPEVNVGALAAGVAGAGSSTVLNIHDGAFQFHGVANAQEALPQFEEALKRFLQEVAGV